VTISTHDEKAGVAATLRLPDGDRCRIDPFHSIDEIGWELAGPSNWAVDGICGDYVSLSDAGATLAHLEMRAL